MRNDTGANVAPRSTVKTLDSGTNAIVVRIFRSLIIKRSASHFSLDLSYCSRIDLVDDEDLEEPYPEPEEEIKLEAKDQSSEEVADPEVFARSAKLSAVSPPTSASPNSFTTAWTPIYFRSSFLDVDNILHVVLLVLLPSGITSRRLNLALSKGNTALDLTIWLPQFIVEPELVTIHKFFKPEERNTENFVLRKHALLQTIRALRSTDDDPIS